MSKKSVAKDNIPAPVGGNPEITLSVQNLKETRKPVTIRRIDTMQMPDIPVPSNGKYYIVSLDKNGNEVPGSGFEIGKRTYEKVYAKMPEQFKVKKNPKL